MIINLPPAGKKAKIAKSKNKFVFGMMPKWLFYTTGT